MARFPRLETRPVFQALLAWSVAAFVWLIAPTAVADAVPPPPDDCPPGSVGDSCHGGEYCRLAGCSDDSDCSGGKTCQELELCVGQIDCASGWDPDAGPSYSTTVEGLCSTSCATCELRRACATPGAASGGGSAADGPIAVDQGCGCSMPGSGGVGSLAGLALLAAAAVASRRRLRS